MVFEFSWVPLFFDNLMVAVTVLKTKNSYEVITVMVNFEINVYLRLMFKGESLENLS